MNKSIICAYPLAPVRKEPSETSEMISQILYGEVVEVLANGSVDWVQINLPEQEYPGWVDIKLFAEVDSKIIYGSILTDICSKLTFGKSQMVLPYGARLNEEVFLVNSKVPSRSVNVKSNVEQLLNDSMKFMNAPYLWGGKSIFGIDCSGFTQVVFQTNGINLFRDAYQQAMQGELVSFNDRKAGDLAFFHNDQKRITHVGLLLNENKIIHASGQVRIDFIQEEGIIHNEKLTLTHRLAAVRRYF